MVHAILSIIAYIVLALLGVAFAAYSYHSLFAPTYSKAYDKIIFVSGSYTNPYLLGPWRWYLQSRFPRSDIEIISGHYGYRDTADERASLIEMKNQVVSRLRAIDSDTQVAVVAYSYGGVLLDAAHHELERAGQAPNLARVVTIASPLGQDALFTDQDFIDSREIIGFSGDSMLNHRVVCGRFDSLVTCRRAVYSDAQSVRSVWSNHYTFILPHMFAGRSIIEEIVRQ